VRVWFIIILVPLLFGDYFWVGGGGFDVGFFFSYLDEKTFSFNFVLNDVFVRYWYSL